jgi:hypothetical protein
MPFACGQGMTTAPFMSDFNVALHCLTERRTSSAMALALLTTALVSLQTLIVGEFVRSLQELPRIRFFQDGYLCESCMHVFCVC